MANFDTDKRFWITAVGQKWLEGKIMVSREGKPSAPSSLPSRDIFP
jgi:hypothetical protein